MGDGYLIRNNGEEIMGPVAMITKDSMMSPAGIVG